MGGLPPQARQETEGELRAARESHALLEREKEEQVSKRDEEVHGKYVYSTLALEKEREIVKEETALRK